MPPPPVTKTLWDLDNLALPPPLHVFPIPDIELLVFIYNPTQNKSDIPRSRLCPSVMDSDVRGHLPCDTETTNGDYVHLMMIFVIITSRK